jgi:hypothetical protein
MQVVDRMMSISGKLADIEDRNVVAWIPAQEATSSRGGVQ